MKSRAVRKGMQGAAWKVRPAEATKPSKMSIRAGRAVYKYYTLSGYKPYFLTTQPKQTNNIIKREMRDQNSSLEKPGKPPESQGKLDYLGNSDIIIIRPIGDKSSQCSQARVRCCLARKWKYS